MAHGLEASSTVLDKDFLDMRIDPEEKQPKTYDGRENTY
jgi:hypothetical protein